MGHFFLDTCETLADLYIHCILNENKQACPSLGTDPWDSLRFFLRGYAFERQGRSPDYAYVAADVINEAKGDHFDAKSAQQIWSAFAQKLGHRKLNSANNPLCPRGSDYTRNYRKVPRTNKVVGLSAVELVGQKLGRQCIVTWTKQAIEAGELIMAYETLGLINGVSAKISSFFMRDVAIMYDLGPASHRTLLQPIDVWIRYVIQTLADKGKLSDEGCADFIVTNSKQPEKVNQGIWYFCAEIADSSRYLVKESIEHPARMNDMIQRHLRQMVENDKIASDYVLRQGVQL